MTAAPASLPAGSPVGALAWRRFRRHRVALASAILLLLFALLSAFAPLFESLSGAPQWRVDLPGRLAPPTLARPLGTDELGRDMFVRILYGGRVSLLVAVVAALASALVGTAIGLFAGWYRGVVDTLLMRLTDSVISLPLLPLLIVLAAVDPAALGLPDAVAASPSFGIWRISLIITLVGWTRVARLVRAATLSVREREFVLAAVAMGAGPLRIMARHILPNVLSPVIVATTLSVGGIVLFESVLSFLGLGIRPPLASWGNMLTGAQDLVWEAPLLVFWPGLAIFATVIAFNFLGDGLQEALDPRASDDRAGE